MGVSCDFEGLGCQCELAHCGLSPARRYLVRERRHCHSHDGFWDLRNSRSRPRGWQRLRDSLPDTIRPGAYLVELQVGQPVALGLSLLVGVVCQLSQVEERRIVVGRPLRGSGQMLLGLAWI